MKEWPNPSVALGRKPVVWLSLAITLGIGNSQADSYLTAREVSGDAQSITDQKSRSSKDDLMVVVGRVIKVVDGDTVNIVTGTTQHRIRLAEIDTPERGQPWGKRARQALANKVFGKEVRVEYRGRDRYGRIIGKIRIERRDVNRELVAEGHAWVYRKYLQDEAFLDVEAEARSSRLGLWGLQADQIMPPWDWRKMRKAERRKAREAGKK